MSRDRCGIEGENRYDLYTIIFELSADRAFQRGRRLRGDSTGTEPDCGTTGMDHDDGVYESYHDRRNDAGTDCGQFSNLCRNSDSGTSGGVAATWGCIFPSCIIVSVLAYIYRRYRGGSAMGNILGSLRPAVVALIAGAGLSMLLAAVLPEVNGERMIQWGSLVLFRQLL